MEFDNIDIYKIAFVVSLTFGVIFFKDYTKSDVIYREIETIQDINVDTDSSNRIGKSKLNKACDKLQYFEHIDNSLLSAIIDKTNKIINNEFENNKECIVLQLELRKLILEMSKIIPKDDLYLWDENVKIIIKETQKQLH